MNKATSLTIKKLVGPAAATVTLSYVYYHHAMPIAHAKQQPSSFFSENNNNNASLQQQQQQHRTLGSSGAHGILATTSTTTTTTSSRPPVYEYNDADVINDLTKVREAIRKAIEDDMEKRGDGTSLYGTFLFLAWICAATYNDDAFHGQKNNNNSSQPPSLLLPVGGTHGAPARLRQMDAEKNSALYNSKNNNNNRAYSLYHHYQTMSGWKVARDALEPVKAKFPSLSYADLYAYAGVVAVEESGGPRIPFRLGRVDNDYNYNNNNGGDPPTAREQQQHQQQYQQQQPSLVERLPEADKGSHVATIQHIRQIFYRMGFNDQEIVALCGAHTLGRCHTTRSCYWGPFTTFENAFDNDYFRHLMQQDEGSSCCWSRKLTHNGKPWMGPDQYEETAALSTSGGGSSSSSSSSNSSSASTTSTGGGGGGGGQLCRLPSDMVLLYDPEFKKWVELYARDRNRFFVDFAKAFAKLLELGVPFPPQKPWWKRWFLFFL